MSTWIVELEEGVYLAPGEGDPERTLVKEHAETFPSHPRAKRALLKTRAYRPFENARVTLAPVEGE